MPSDICCVLFEYRFSIPAPVKRRHRALVVTNFVSLISVPSTKSSLTPLFLLFPKSLPTFREPLRSSYSHIPFGLVFNFQGTVKKVFHLFPLGRAKLSGVFEKFFVLQKIPSLIWTKGAEMHTHFRAFSRKFFEKKFTLHLFGITKPNDTLFLRKTEKYFFRLRVLYFACPKKVPSLILTENGQMHPLISKNYPFTYLELECQNATCFREKFLKKNKKICPPGVAGKEILLFYSLNIREKTFNST